MEKKRCSRCGEVKGVGEFYKSYNWCIKCSIEHRKKYYENNKEKLIKYSRKYYNNNKDIIAANSKINRDNNKDIIAARFKKYYENNKEKFAKRGKKYRDNNIVWIGKKHYNIKTCSPEQKPVIQALIDLRNKKKFIKEAQNG